MKYLRLSRAAQRAGSYENTEGWLWAQLQASLARVHREREKSHA